MEAKELRIGNLVDYEKTTHKITAISEDYSNSVWINKEKEEFRYVHKHSELEPIPLTEEWLLKFGFETQFNNIFKILHIDDNFGFSVKLYSSHSFKDKIKHVHQLQNLYFALTGEELSCN